MRPLILTSPVVGAVMREMIFSNVDFPAPLAPTIAMVSPCLRSKEMSFRAQKSPFSSGSAIRGVIACRIFAPIASSTSGECPQAAARG